MFGSEWSVDCFLLQVFCFDRLFGIEAMKKFVSSQQQGNDTLLSMFFAGRIEVLAAITNGSGVAHFW